ncbi:TonB-dependent receptor [Sphingomonas sp. AR_OL41]|uniref:TonB-dependent receptor n=1 Tax=Sphingomonas sp. AR_OL41 TaxID=3042729 RepID=UPI00247FA1C4|nr:TonB-dependent receptor [Sphingomonas sp. AR_OL41]MDH7972337.1 TonB-dependent receptor [Sphingomonas sp. AR_OL41]
MITGRSILGTSTAMALAMMAMPAVAKTTAPAAPAPAADPAQDQTPNGDIVVTAQHRIQNLIDVPQSISVISGATLERQQAISFQDYAQLVPSLTLTQENPGETRLVLRGVNTGSVGSTVAVYVDDVPFGSSGSLSNGGILAGDFDTFDVARVEVLKGPQGTLYGSNSLGGVLKFVTGTPSTQKLEVRGLAGIETTQSGEASYNGNALINVPLGDTLALRASGFYHRIGGYVNAIGRAGSNINHADSFGGRASLLFKPTDELSIRLTGLIQNINVGSPANFEVDPVTLKPVNALTGAAQGTKRTRFELYPELNTVHYQLYNGTINYNLGFGTLTSVTSYATQKQKQISDISTNSARGTAQAVYGAAGTTNTIGLAYQNDISLNKFTQEVRFASADSDSFEWLIGGYYTHEKTRLYQEYLPFTIATRALIPPATTFSGLTFSKFVYAMIDASYEEYAGFASGTLHLGPKFDITAGGRYSHNNQSSTQAVIQLGGGTPIKGGSSEGVFTWSVAPRFEIDRNNSIYGRVAKGYRPGGPNFVPPGAPATFPTQFNSDTLISYEAGYRGETANHAFSVDVAAFYIDWKNILITTSTTVNGTPVGINGNGQRARSYGVEGTVTLRPTRGLSVVGNLTYTKAKLLDDTVPAVGGLNLTGGLAGDQLPYSPVWNANVSADYEWSVGPNARAYIGGNIHLIADQAATFNTAYRAAYGRRLTLDGYQTVDLRAGVNFDRFSLGVYVKNLTNEYALSNVTYATTVPTAIGGTNTPLARAVSIRPRTFGATLGFNF